MIAWILDQAKERSTWMGLFSLAGAVGLGLLVSNGLLKEHQTRDRQAVGAACLAALEQWSMGRGARTLER